MLYTIFLTGNPKGLFGGIDAFAVLINVRSPLPMEDQHTDLTNLAPGELRKQRDICSKPWGHSTSPQAHPRYDEYEKTSCVAGLSPLDHHFASASDVVPCHCLPFQLISQLS